MQVSTFDFNFTFKGTKLNATCHKMKVHKHPQIRVAIQQKEGRADIYLFYEINEPGQKYFWFELNDIKQEIAKVIAKNWRE